MERKHQLGCLHSLIVLHQWVIKFALQDVLYTKLLKLVVHTLYFIANWRKFKFFHRKIYILKTLLINQIKIFLDSQFTVDCGTISKKQKQYTYIYITAVVGI